MKGDYSRASFSPRKHYTSVRMQQGRVQLDSDWNEQADITRDTIAAHARDLLGAGAAPSIGAGFALGMALRQRVPDGPELPDISISAGCYYVDGLRCENEQSAWYSEQPGAADPLPPDDHVSLLYLDAWERHITVIEDPELREPALGGPDTTTRTQVVWHIRALPLALDQPAASGEPTWARAWRAFAESRARRPRMAAAIGKDNSVPCNQLYRVEVHSVDGNIPSYKWSRENGAVAFPILKCVPQATGAEHPLVKSSAARLRVTCTLLERDRLALKAGDIVELEDDQTALGAAGSLLGRVFSVGLTPGTGEQLGTLVGELLIDVDATDAAALLARWPAGNLVIHHPLLRRWDNQGMPPGSWKLPQFNKGNAPHPLEHGLTIHFEDDAVYTPGDYWQIAVRMGAFRLDMPARPPDGVTHRLAPLGLLSRGDGQWQIADLRFQFRALPQLSDEFDGQRRRLDGTATDLAALRANFDALLDEVRYLRHKIKDLRGRLHHDYHADDELARGDVVAADPAREGYIVKTQAANERLVIGVIGEILSDHGSAIYRVIVYGRVPCKVVGPVAPGDLLTVADEAGYARCAGIYIRPGTVIGKALAAAAPDESGRAGVVDAMITLA